MAKPFLKWAGGKRSLAQVLTKLIPEGWFETRRDYHEPFLGGGAIFFEMHNSIGKAWLSDSNAQLINAYSQVKRDARAIMSVLDRWKSDEETYYVVRDDLKTLKDCDPAALAARFIYLNKTCFNGLHREGPKGFNVPWGRKPGAKTYEIETLEAASKALGKAKIWACDFKDAFVSVASGALVYIDPPYVPKTKSSFTRYSGESFGYKDHERLRDAVHLLAKRAWVVLSNADSPWVRDAYGDFQINFVKGRRSIGAKSETRKTEDDVIVVAGPGLKPKRRTLDAR